jgi:hypothetical protein
MSQGRAEEDDGQRLLHQVFVLLDFLERQNDNRLQAHFDDTRAKLGIGTARAAMPPCDKYADFFTRLTEIRKNPNNTLGLEDERFLRLSRDFLAAVAAPVTVETIAITHEYVRTRTAWAANGWRTWLLPRGASVRERRDRAGIEDEGFRDSAHWLARLVRRLERATVLITAVALVLSAHAMVGRLIISQEEKALATFQELSRSADADRIGLFRVAGALSLLRFEHSDHGCPARYKIETPGSTLDETNTIKILQKQQNRFAEISQVGDPGTAAQEAAWSLVAKCRGVQWALMQLIAENVRLKSWDNVYIKWLPLLVGWDQNMVDTIGSTLKPKFCQQVAEAYHEDRSQADCMKTFDLLMRDSTSLASSVLTFVTMYVLPCLYAFIGAAMAALIGLRRRVETSLLSYSDRGRIKQAIILGFVFGGIIGLFAGYFTKPLESDGLGLSALALLAGYNVPAVSEFLEDLSKRIFRPAEFAKSGAPAT